MGEGGGVRFEFEIEFKFESQAAACVRARRVSEFDFTSEAACVGEGVGRGGAQSEFEPSSSLNSTSNRRPGCRNRRVLVEEFKFEFVKEANPASNTQTNPKEVKPSATETLMK